MARGRRVSKRRGVLSVIRYAPTTRGEPLAPRGSIVVFLATAGSERLGTIDAAARGGKAVRRLLPGADTVPREPTATVSLRYGDRLLAADVPVPGDGEPVRLILPYNGGQIVPEDLAIVEEGSQGRVAAVVVVYPPRLSRVEQAALLLVPPELLHLNVGPALPGGIAGINDEERRRAVEEARLERDAARAEALAENAAARAGGLDVHLADKTVIALGPALAASAMLEVRREMLGGMLPG